MKLILKKIDLWLGSCDWSFSDPSWNAILLRTGIFQAWRWPSCMQPIFLKRFLGSVLSAPICLSSKKRNMHVTITHILHWMRWWFRIYCAFSRFGWSLRAIIAFTVDVPIPMPKVWLWRRSLTAQGSILLFRLRRCVWIIISRIFYKSKTILRKISGSAY